MNSSQEIASNIAMWGGIKKTGWANLYPTEQYGVDVISDFGSIEMQSFVADGSVDDMNVYAPSLDGFTDSDVQGIQDLYDSCGMVPISEEYYGSKVDCSL